MYCIENCGLLSVASGKHNGGTWYYRLFRKADIDEEKKKPAHVIWKLKPSENKNNNSI